METMDNKVKMKIPSGTPGNKMFRLKGKGMPNLYTQRYGDLYIRINVDVPTRLTDEQKELLRRLGNSL